MELFKIDQELTQSLLSALQEKECNLSSNDLAAVIEEIKERVLSHSVHLLISQIESILDISPNLSERDILQKVAKSVVEYLGAEAATLRIYDPFRERLVVFGSFPDWETDRKEAISLEDTIAGEVARALKAERLILLSDIPGVLRDKDDPDSMIPSLSAGEADQLIATGKAAGGMIPKLKACLRALGGGVKKAHIIDGRVPHSVLLELFTDTGVGTQVFPDV